MNNLKRKVFQLRESRSMKCEESVNDSNSEFSPRGSVSGSGGKYLNYEQIQMIFREKLVQYH